jgi:hypothetical protein
MIDPNFSSALHMLYDRLENSDLRWAITGSLGMVLHGMDLEIHDIDIQSDLEDAYLIQALFSHRMVEPVHDRRTEILRSQFGSFNFSGVQVEIMGGMQRKQPDNAWSDPIKVEEHSDLVVFEEMNLPVMKLDYEYHAYLAMGRMEKAQKIKAWLDGHSS